jgi:hypothetical protein
MNNNVNPVIIIPSIAKKIAIAIYNEQNFYEQNYDFIPLLNIYDNQTPRNLVKRFTPSLNLFDASLFSSLKNICDVQSNYHYGIVGNLKINEIPFYKPVDTFTWSKYIASPQNNVLKTQGQLDMMVLLPFEKDRPNSKFLQQIWRLAVYWFVPFFISADVYPQNIGGPVFVKTFTITASESVNVKITFTGASTLKVPFFNSLSNPYDEDLTNVAIGANTNGIIFEEKLTRGVFRTAKNYDCFLVLSEAASLQQGIYTAYNVQKEDLFIQGNNIVEISLTIENDIQEIYTANNGFTKNIVDGMRFISMKSRKVSGSISFLATENLQEYFSVSIHRTLILFFGGPFYFPMKNVFFDAFDLTINAEDPSYKHSVKFTALLQESKYPEYYKQNEFDINYEGLLHAPTGEIYATPQ